MSHVLIVMLSVVMLNVKAPNGLLEMNKLSYFVSLSVTEKKSLIMLRPEKEILSVMRIHWCERCAETESPGGILNQKNFFSYSRK